MARKVEMVKFLVGQSFPLLVLSVLLVACWATWSGINHTPTSLTQSIESVTTETAWMADVRLSSNTQAQRK